MFEPLLFYPAPGLAKLHRWIAGIAAASATLLLATLTRAPVEVDASSWLRDAATVVLALVCAGVGLVSLRRARRIADARTNDEPQLVVDPFGVLIRDDFLWRAHRFPWSRVRSIDPVPEQKGLSIRIAGELRPLGRLVDITTDSDEPAEAVVMRLERMRRGPTLH